MPARGNDFEGPEYQAPSAVERVDRGQLLQERMQE